MCRLNTPLYSTDFDEFLVFAVFKANPVKYTDPDGKADVWGFSNPLDAWGQTMAQMARNPLDKLVGWIFSAMGHNKAVNQQING